VANGGKPAVNRIVAKLGGERCRVIKMPCKVDDMVTKYGATAEDLMTFIYHGLKA
jgi:hypothetical protein